MANIAVFEDNSSDVIFRYRSLTQRHALSIYFIRFSRTPEETQLLLEQLTERLKNINFDYKSLAVYPSVDAIPLAECLQADLFLLDGLNGAFYRLAPKLPKDKIICISSDLGIIDGAQSLGYRSVRACELSETIDKMLQHA